MLQQRSASCGISLNYSHHHAGTTSLIVKGHVSFRQSLQSVLKTDEALDLVKDEVKLLTSSLNSEIVRYNCIIS